MINKSEFFLSIIASILLLLLFVMLSIDAVSFLNDSEDYVHVYNLDPTKEFWQWDYLQNSVMLIGFASIGLILNFLAFSKKDYKWLISMRAAINIILMLAMIYGYFKWYLTGFDH